MKCTLVSLRSLATARLMQYRRYRNFLRQQNINIRAANGPSARGANKAVRAFDPALRDITQMRGWVRAIDRVREHLAAENTRKAMFMDRCFGLDPNLPFGRSARANLVSATIDIEISESTAYKWREGILDLVLFAAIEAGVLRPFERDVSATDPQDG